MNKYRLHIKGRKGWPEYEAIYEARNKTQAAQWFAGKLAHLGKVVKPSVLAPLIEDVKTT